MANRLVIQDCECWDKDNHGVCTDCGREWTQITEEGPNGSFNIYWERK